MSIAGNNYIEALGHLQAADKIRPGNSLIPQSPRGWTWTYTLIFRSAGRHQQHQRLPFIPGQTQGGYLRLGIESDFQSSTVPPGVARPEPGNPVRAGIVVRPPEEARPAGPHEPVCGGRREHELPQVLTTPG
jgi:hypothetical protein